MVLTRKIQLFPVGDKEEINRVYKFLRDGQYAQYRALNILMGQLMSEFYAHNMDFKNEDFKSKQKALMTNSNPLLDNIEFAKGVDTKSAVNQKVKQDFSTFIKNDGMKGKRSCVNYKKNFPLIVRSRNLTFYHNYENYNDFLDRLHSSDLDVCIKFVNGINFKVILGNPHKSEALREEIKQIFEEHYKLCGSSIQIDEKKIILNLSMEIPNKEVELDENTVVGVDLGLAIPAVCGLNNNTYIKQSIGAKDDFLKVRTQIQSQRRRLQKSLQSTSGGHGRSKKMKAMDRISTKEKNFVQTYNHFVSKNVVDFAVKNKAAYINLEDLSGFDSSEFILRNWSFYQLQQYIEYKAAKYGIKVRKINPYHTSQTCSCCGHWEEGQRISQSEFRCKNPECNNFGKMINADFNASRNIAMSTDFR